MQCKKKMVEKEAGRKGGRKKGERCNSRGHYVYIWRSVNMDFISENLSVLMFKLLNVVL